MIRQCSQQRPNQYAIHYGAGTGRLNRRVGDVVPVLVEGAAETRGTGGRDGLSVLDALPALCALPLPVFPKLGLVCRTVWIRLPAPGSRLRTI